MSSFGFVVLHYNTIEETRCCIKSIEDCYSDHDYYIAIVDNASPNHSGEVLFKEYSQDPRIHVILSKENLGFAKGNNLGCRWFAENVPVDFLIICNSDLVFIDKEFLDGIVLAYNKTQFDIMGPDIVDPNCERHQNPRREKPITIKELNKEIILKEFMIQVYKGNFACEIIYKLARLIKKNIPFKKNRIAVENKSFNTEIDAQCVLYGACIIASKRCYEWDYNIFPTKTFLYYEEDFLRKKMDDHSRISIFYPYIKVIHKVNGTTSTMSDNHKETTIIKLQYALESAKKLKQELLS